VDSKIAELERTGKFKIEKEIVKILRHSPKQQEGDDNKDDLRDSTESDSEP